MSGSHLSRAVHSLIQSVVDVELGSRGGSAVKNLPAMQFAGDSGSIPGSDRSPGGGHSSSLQSSCLENPSDRGAWWAPVHGVAKSQARLKQLSICAHTRHGVKQVYIHFLFPWNLKFLKSWTGPLLFRNV